jgi:uncharacterized protein YqgC (DUF456 family)
VGPDDDPITLLAGAAIVIGVVGVVVPVLPGLWLCWLGVLGWALLTDSGPTKWVVLGVATAITLIGTIVKYAVPGKRLKRAGVSNLSLFAGGILGIVGFFLIPIVGLVLGFVLGIFAAERLRLGQSRAAWVSTKHALKATGLSLLIELAAALGVAATWVAGLVAVA